MPAARAVAALVAPNVVNNRCWNPACVVSSASESNALTNPLASAARLPPSRTISGFSGQWRASFELQERPEQLLGAQPPFSATHRHPDIRLPSSPLTVSF